MTKWGRLIAVTILTVLAVTELNAQTPDKSIDLTTPPAAANGNAANTEPVVEEKETKEAEEEVDLTTPPSVETGDAGVKDDPTTPQVETVIDLSDPTQVEFYIFVLDIDDINGASQSFFANLFMMVRWIDPRLAHEEPAAIRIPLANIWHPQVILANPKGLVRKSLDETAIVEPDGTVMYRQHYFGTLAQALELQDFPMDQHTFSIHFVTVDESHSKIEFIPATMKAAYTLPGGEISAQLSLPDWDILSYRGAAKEFEPISTVMVPGFVFEFTARRRALYYFFQIIIPLAVVVAMSWGAFWIDPSLASSQIGVATSAILSLIAYRFVLAGLLPRLPYMTRLDYLMLGSTVLVFLALVEVVAASLLAHHDRQKQAIMLDYISRVGFPATFIMLFFWSLYL